MILISSGEPSGIGPDIVLQLTKHRLSHPWVVLGNVELFESRAKKLNLPVKINIYSPNTRLKEVVPPNEIWIWPISLKSTCEPGILNSNNAAYVLELLKTGAEACITGLFDALVTAPIHKGIIADAGFVFTGHTEYFAELTATNEVVMMLASKKLRVALVTTHLPLREVPDAITQKKLTQVIHIIYHDLKKYFGLDQPRIYVCGLNPHAGENGHLGREEIEIIAPVLKKLKDQGIFVEGPFPADSLFTKNYLNKADVFLAMYHDQGLSVLKYAAFDEAVNITLGLPFIRTSVDHGTALDLAGTGKASENSLLKAIEVAIHMIKPILSLIVAASENNAIGKNNQLLWHMPADFRYFKEKTLGKPIIMGRKTFESIGRPLPHRQNIVITRDTHFHCESVLCAHSLPEAIQLAGNVPEIMILGGGNIFEQALPLADKVYLTRIHHTFEGDVFFPELDEREWRLIEEEHHTKDEKNSYDYTFSIFGRLPTIPHYKKPHG